ncbi:HAD family hydrolase [Brevibacillus sp. MS2.2]|uniref:HAD family hydrolase n=1 Tax=Brevibacillus sp. MS2.2 TaxID=2738981 RepID=UPI00156B7DC9|nr:HAD-IA family hydrolase [Brevibacillus sp. MS2.2]NRR24122.1 HAD-IA family hydrolase [Brevibacillus sp. MS2.2]
MVTACLFDLDGTLLDRERSLDTFLARQYERTRPLQKKMSLEAFKFRFHELDQRGYVWKDVVYQTILEESKIEEVTSLFLLEEYVHLFWQDCLSFRGVVETLQILNQLGMKLGIITNGRSEFQMKNLNAIGIEPFFHAILISEREGVSKPESIIFERALDRLGVKASEAVYVGDHPVNDVQGARAAGMKSVWKRDMFWGDNVEADAIIDEIPELITILGEWREK